ncbi:MAG: hypothetical protein P9L88_00465 [Candidatus Tantalella remota]|nr:hypothetical protein [Candidatus Tantalella remota]
MNYRKTIIFSIILAGATAIVSQIIFMREFLVVFYGNEISIGVILASWLVWGAFGSAVLGRFSDRIQTRVRVFAVLQVVLAIALPAALLAIRSAKGVMGMSPGEIVGYVPMILSSFVILAVPCAIMGFMFSLACRIYKGKSDLPAENIARVYILEAVGALVGGVAVSCFIIRFVDPLAILLSLSLLNMAASVLIERFCEPSRVKRAGSLIFSAVMIVFIIALAAGGASWLREVSLQRLWQGFDVLGSRNSVYGNITVTERGPQRSFYENGLHMYTVPDRLSAEESVHFALLEHDAPEDVLLIGGGVGGLLEEVLKHPVQSVDYVELDPTIISMAEEYLSPESILSLSDPRVNIINADGRFFVKRTKRKYDCVIISLGDPYTAQINRFYTVGFFKELSRVMNEDAVVSFSLTSSENYISTELRDYLGSIYLSVSAVFPDVFMIPGDSVYFLASKKPESLLRDTDALMKRMSERGVDAVYVRDYYLEDKLSEERVKYAKDTITSGSSVEENRDFKPVSYYYATVFWSTHFDSSFFRNLLSSATPGKIWTGLTVACFLMIFFIFLVRRGRSRKAVLLAVMTTGFAEINFQIAVMISFQVIYGYVFYKLGMIITSFMVGLAFGGWLITKVMGKIKDDMKVFTWTQVSICIYPLLLPVIFMWLSGARSDAVSWMGSNIIFPFIPAVAGIIGGIQFPLANKIYLEDRKSIGRVSGLSYGLDLLGACAGALLASAFFIPVLGIFGACLLVALINVTVLAILLIR